MAEDPLSLLCIEPRFPGRALGPVADWLVRRRGYRCQFYCTSAEPQQHWPTAVGKGLDLVQFTVGGVARETAVPWTRCLERGLCYAYGCWERLKAQQLHGIDVVLGRSAGLGSTLFVPVSLPGAPLVNLFDYYYPAHTHDLAGEAGPDTAVEYFHWRRAANAMDLLDLENGVIPWVPTAWQRDLYPAEYRPDFTVLYDGVDHQRFTRQANRPRTVAGRLIPPEARVVSFVARQLDCVRGFDRFLRLANALLRLDPQVLCLVAGGGTVERGLDIEFYQRDYPAHLLAQSPPHDPKRFWMLGYVPQAVVAELLAATDLYLYSSRPYVVARSLLEAMSSGCVVLAGDSEPVREFLTHGQTGLLVPPADDNAWLGQARAVLENPVAHRPLGEAAAALVATHYAQDVTLPALARLLDRLVEGRR